jgi:hypothetical protein
MSELDWKPTMDFKKAVAVTASWYKDNHEGANPYTLTKEQTLEWLSIDH